MSSRPSNAYRRRFARIIRGSSSRAIDSKRECGSRVDRHEHIGKGRIGKTSFAHFVNDVRFRDVPVILETPKGKDGRGTHLDKVNLKRLRSLVGVEPLDATEA